MVFVEIQIQGIVWVLYFTCFKKSFYPIILGVSYFCCTQLLGNSYFHLMKLCKSTIAVPFWPPFPCKYSAPIDSLLSNNQLPLAQNVMSIGDILVTILDLWPPPPNWDFYHIVTICVTMVASSHFDPTIAIHVYTVAAHRPMLYSKYAK